MAIKKLLHPPKKTSKSHPNLLFPNDPFFFLKGPSFLFDPRSPIASPTQSIHTPTPPLQGTIEDPVVEGEFALPSIHHAETFVVPVASGASGRWGEEEGDPHGVFGWRKGRARIRDLRNLLFLSGKNGRNQALVVLQPSSLKKAHGSKLSGTVKATSYKSSTSPLFYTHWHQEHELAEEMIIFQGPIPSFRDEKIVHPPVKARKKKKKLVAQQLVRTKKKHALALAKAPGSFLSLRLELRFLRSSKIGQDAAVSKDFQNSAQLCSHQKSPTSKVYTG